MLITALVFAVAAAPIFLFLKERAQPRASSLGALTSADGLWTLAGQSFREICSTLKSLGRFRDFAWLSLCGFLYQSGIAVVITLSAVYAAEVMGFTTVDTLMLVFLGFSGLGISIWPNIIPPNIDIWAASAPPQSQGFMLVGALLIIPVILTYTAWSYYVFRGKVTPGQGYH